MEEYPPPHVLHTLTTLSNTDGDQNKDVDKTFEFKTINGAGKISRKCKFWCLKEIFYVKVNLFERNRLTKRIQLFILLDKRNNRKSPSELRDDKVNFGNICKRFTIFQRMVFDALSQKFSIVSASRKL